MNRSVPKAPARGVPAPVDAPVGGTTGSITVGEVLHAYLRDQDLPEDSGMSQTWVKVRFLGLPLVFPNFDARRAVLVPHDVHHMLTGYDTSWRGEGEIGGFEIATGCKRFWAAWFFNLYGFLFGLCIAPVRTFRAFVRGRRCRNFYGHDMAAVLARELSAARWELGLDGPAPRARVADAVAFAGWVAFVAIFCVAPPLLVLYGLLAWLL